MSPNPDATVDGIIREFAHAGATLPKAAMRRALENRDTVAPQFVQLLNRYADGADRTAETRNALFFVIHLLGEMGETAAFPVLCRLMEDPDAPEEILGDGITESLAGVMIRTYDGDAGPLKRVIEAPGADEFVRGVTLHAMAYLTRVGTFTDDEMRAYLSHLRAEARPRADCYIWCAWATAAANLGYGDFAGEVETLLRDGLIPALFMNMDDFHRQLRRTLDDPERLAGFHFDHIAPLTDAVGALSGWYGFSDARRAESERLAQHLVDEDAADETPWPVVPAPHVNPLRHVGRNDPCPCGSGRKFKQCCLQ